MRNHTIQEVLLSKHVSDTPKIRIDNLFRSRSPKSKGSTLEEFYREVYAASAQSEQTYLNKNAREIESMMVQNRRLIESKRPFKK